MADMAFSNVRHAEAVARGGKETGFYNGHTPANKLFSAWFFKGLDRTPNFKPGIDKKKAQRAMNWAVCYMRSFAPKHEHKEAVCALIFDAALEIPAT